MNILIIGSEGYVGTEVSSLLAQSSNVTKIDAGWFGIRDANTIVADIRDIAHSFDFSNFDCVVYLAAVSNDPMGRSFAEITHEINHKSAILVAKLAKKQGVAKFIFASSCSAYGDGGNEARSETDMLNPLTDYALSKVQAEESLQKFADHNFNVYALRFATACGSSENLRLDLVVNDFVASAITSNVIKVNSNGEPFRPLISVRDMARAIKGVVEAKNNKNDAFFVYNVGSNAFTFRIKHLAYAVASLLSFEPTVEINHEAAADNRSYRVDFSKFNVDFPDHIPDQDLSKVVSDLEQQIVRLVEINGDDYKNWVPHNRLKALKMFFK